jgi:hypothetical protein
METCLPIAKKAIHYYLEAFYNNSSHKLEMEKGGLWIEEIECVCVFLGGWGGGGWMKKWVGFCSTKGKSKLQ